MSTVKEGIAGIWKHRSMGFASVTSIAMALLILGAIIIATVTMNQAVLDVQTKVDQVDIMLDQNVTTAEIQNLRHEIESNPDVGRVDFMTKEQNMEQFRESIEVDRFMLDGMEDAFPSSFIVRMKNIAGTQSFVDHMKTQKGVFNIRYYQDVIGKIVKLSHYLQFGGAIAVAILVFISIIIISNTIKLTVLARRKEIQIKKYIGASNPVITNPFIIEGLFFGLVGSIVAFLVIYFGYDFLYRNYSSQVLNLVSTYLVAPKLLFKQILKIFLALGIGIGTLGSLLSIRKYLNV